MSAEEYNRHLQLRRDSIAVFLAKPERYKVCEHCRSVCPRGYPLCPFCHAYCFIEEPSYVKETARIMGSFAFPLCEGVASRI